MLPRFHNTKERGLDMATVQRSWQKKKNQIGKTGGERKKNPKLKLSLPVLMVHE